MLVRLAFRQMSLVLVMRQAGDSVRVRAAIAQSRPHTLGGPTIPERHARVALRLTRGNFGAAAFVLLVALLNAIHMHAHRTKAGMFAIVTSSVHHICFHACRPHSWLVSERPLAATACTGKSHQADSLPEDGRWNTRCTCDLRGAAEEFRLAAGVLRVRRIRVFGGAAVLV